MSFPATQSPSVSRPAYGSAHAYGAASGAAAAGYAAGPAGGYRPGATGAPAAGAYGAQAARYRDAELAAATPGQLVVMLFDKILLTLRRARLAIEGKRIAERVELLLKANEMLGELRVSLDFDAGGDIARQLDALYGYAMREVLEANRLQDAARVDVVLRVVGELRDAFAQIVAGQGGTTAPTPAPAPTATPALVARSA